MPFRPQESSFGGVIRLCDFAGQIQCVVGIDDTGTVNEDFHTVTLNDLLDGSVKTRTRGTQELIFLGLTLFFELSAKFLEFRTFGLELLHLLVTRRVRQGGTVTLQTLLHLLELLAHRLELLRTVTQLVLKLVHGLFGRVGIQQRLLPVHNGDIRCLSSSCRCRTDERGRSHAQSQSQFTHSYLLLKRDRHVLSPSYSAMRQARSGYEGRIACCW
ncbi:predicted ATPase, RNase L inhibitor [Zymobacter palmae]|uniref:Predicted ATPase, RNase L inhibitor n=1 Tax=Zymobacter palmae TaxID=33074 RepID=A0A348HD13_9GAMM|nr:predicted ATPase, RNase L inhibitor [Zymobacter palmae]